MAIRTPGLQFTWYRNDYGHLTVDWTDDWLHVLMWIVILGSNDRSKMTLLKYSLEVYYTGELTKYVFIHGITGMSIFLLAQHVPRS